MRKIAILGTLALFLSAAAGIPGGYQMDEGTFLLVQPNGQTMTMTPSAGKMKMLEDAMMKHGTEMKSPIVVMMHDGKMMMMMNDMKMDDGKMISDEIMAK